MFQTRCYITRRHMDFCADRPLGVGRSQSRSDGQYVEMACFRNQLTLIWVIIVCLPSLRPIYRLVVKGTLKSTQQQSGYQWNERTNPRTLDTFKTTYSDSTRQLAAVDGDGNRSFNEALDSSRSTDTTCEMDNMNPSRMHDSTKGIMVKNEVHVKTSSKAAQV